MRMQSRRVAADEIGKIIHSVFWRKNASWIWFPLYSDYPSENMIIPTYSAF